MPSLGEPPPPPVAALIAVETGHEGNLGALLRVAANFGVPAVELVRPLVSPDDPEVLSWACGARERLEVSVFGSLPEAASPYGVLVGTTSGRGRDRQPVIGPRELAFEVSRRGPQATALVVGNETWGLRREDLDRCDLVVRVPTNPEFPVLNLAQSAAVLLGHLAITLDPTPSTSPTPAAAEEVDHLVDHLRRSLLAVGYLDPVNPERILRKLRRLLGRAGVTHNEVAILRGICRQVEWAAAQLSALGSPAPACLGEGGSADGEDPSAASPGPRSLPT